MERIPMPPVGGVLLLEALTVILPTLTVHWALHYYDRHKPHITRRWQLRRLKFRRWTAQRALNRMAA